MSTVMVHGSHPYSVLAYMDRTQLFNVFHRNMIPEISVLLGEGTYHEPLPGYERAWRIFLGANINGHMHFVCHIAQGFSTAKGYNCEDSTTPKCPVLLHGEPFHVRTEVMDSVRAQFPAHHHGSVPFQAAFAVVPKVGNHYYPHTILELLNGTTTAVDTPNFQVTAMTPTGTESLSFKRNGFPLEFWTHSSRAPVIFTALQKENEKLQPNTALVALYGQACALETAFTGAVNTLKANETNLANKETQLQRENQSLLDIVNNMRIPADRKQAVIAQKQARIAQMTAERDALRTLVTHSQQQLLMARQAIDMFKAQYGENLPHSYREATFQTAFSTTLPDGSVVYKQYNGETGKFELSQNPDRAVRYLDAVHTPYLDLPV